MADAHTALPLPPSLPARTSAPRPKRWPRRYHAEFVDLKNFKIQHELLRTVPVELMFRYNFVPIEQQEDALVIAVSDPSRLMVLDEIAGLLGAPHHSARGHALADHRPAEENRAVAARAGRGQRGADLRRADRRRQQRREHLHREADQRRGHQPHHPPGGHHHLHRAGAARLRHSHRDLRRLGACEVPHRRRAAGGHGAHRARAPHHHSEPHQDHERAGHRRAPRAPGRPLPGSLQEPPDRLPRLHHAHDSRRKRRAARAGQGVDEREVPPSHARRGGLCRRGPEALPRATSASLTAWCW